MSRFRSLRTLLALLLAMLLVVAACGDDDGGGEAASDRTEETDRSDDDDEKIRQGVFDRGEREDGTEEDEDDIVFRTAIEDVERFLEDAYPAMYGDRWEPLAGTVEPYGPDDPPRACRLDAEDEDTEPYEAIGPNAFYCAAGDFVTWDTENLTDDIIESFGPVTLAVYAAHEMGHAVQNRHDIFFGSPEVPDEYEGFFAEQQADCIAGAWLGWVVDGESEEFEADLGDLDLVLGGMIEIRDNPGIGVDDPTGTAHGSAFQRVQAFKDGFDNGAEFCAGMEDENDVIARASLTQNLFLNPEDLEAGGNLPLEALFPLIETNLNGFWGLTFQSIDLVWTEPVLLPYDPFEEGALCGTDSLEGEDAEFLAFYCAEDDTITFDIAYPVFLHEEIGDVAAATMVANLYSERVQTLTGLADGSINASLQADCFTGSWIGAIATGEYDELLPEEGVIILSPGDLDEALISFFRFSSDAEDVESGDALRGTAFQRFEAFGAGYVTSLSAGTLAAIDTCLAYTEN